MSTATDFTIATVSLGRAESLARSALPDAPVVPDSARESLVTRVRRTLAPARPGFHRHAPVLADNPIVTTS